MMAHGCRHGDSERDEQDVAMPTVAGASLAVIEAEFVIGRFETVLDGPTLAIHLDQGSDIRVGREPGGEECEVAVAGDFLRLAMARLADMQFFLNRPAR